MTLGIILLIVGLAIILLIPIISRKVLYKKLTKLLSQKDYQGFEELLDGFLCTFSFKPYNREYMRLTSYFMQNKPKKISEQLDNIFDRFKMNDTQESETAKRGFYFYLEIKNYEKADKMLKICKEKDNNINEVEIMEVMYSILAKKESKYIQNLRSRLDILKKDSNAYTNNAKRVRIGIYEYLVGLQYYYLHNKKESRKYLESALKNCKNTPYEPQIKEILY